MYVKSANRRLLALTALLLWPQVHNAVLAEPVKSLLEMRQENVVLQEWDLSCGAAALATLLRYQYGDAVTEKEIATALLNRQEYLDNPELVKQQEGFSLLDLKRVAEAHGYRGIGLGKMTLAGLERRAPILVSVQIRGYSHFVVFRGRQKNRVLFADPAWGNRTMTVEQFERAWIDHPEIGRIGFVVHSDVGPTADVKGLYPKPSEFLTFN